MENNNIKVLTEYTIIDVLNLFYFSTFNIILEQICEEHQLNIDDISFDNIAIINDDKNIIIKPQYIDITDDIKLLLEKNIVKHENIRSIDVELLDFKVFKNDDTDGSLNCISINEYMLSQRSEEFESDKVWNVHIFI